jgi:hypothetical protein
MPEGIERKLRGTLRWRRIKSDLARDTSSCLKRPVTGILFILMRTYIFSKYTLQCNVHDF